jgi:hypothetical protein
MILFLISAIKGTIVGAYSGWMKTQIKETQDQKLHRLIRALSEKDARMIILLAAMDDPYSFVEQMPYDEAEHIHDIVKLVYTELHEDLPN